jgi:hypothetical protein
MKASIHPCVHLIQRVRRNPKMNQTVLIWSTGDPFRPLAELVYIQVTVPTSLMPSLDFWAARLSESSSERELVWVRPRFLPRLLLSLVDVVVLAEGSFCSVRFLVSSGFVCRCLPLLLSTWLLVSFWFCPCEAIVPLSMYLGIDMIVVSFCRTCSSWCCIR